MLHSNVVTHPRAVAGRPGWPAVLACLFVFIGTIVPPARAMEDPMSQSHLIESLEPRVLLSATFDYAAAPWSAADVSVNGSASLSGDDQSLLLTSGTNQKASAFFKTKVSTDNFSTSFTWTPSATVYDTGFSIVWHNDADGLGYDQVGTDTATAASGIGPAARLNILSSGHYKRGTLSVSGATPAVYSKEGMLRPEMGTVWTGGHTYRFEISQGEGNILHVAVTDVSTGDIWYQPIDIDLSAVVGSSAWVGFTGATTSATNTQTIDDWTYTEAPDELPAVAMFRVSGFTHNTALEGNIFRVRAGEAVRFDATDSVDPDFAAGDTLSYEWDFDYDGSTFSVDATDQALDQSFTPGTYTVALRVIDGDGNVSALRTTTIQADAGPLAVITPSRTEGTGPTGVMFDATRSAGLIDGDILNPTFHWNFDVTNVNPAGKYEQADGFLGGYAFTYVQAADLADGTLDGFVTYTVRLTVTDIDGQSHSSDTQITVHDFGESWTTYYFAADGDNTTGDGSIENPFRSLSKAVSVSGSKTRVLFRRGDTFTTNVYRELWGSGGYWGAYTDPDAPSDAKPVLQATTGCTKLLFVNAADRTFEGLRFDGAGIAGGWGSTPARCSTAARSSTPPATRSARAPSRCSSTPRSPTPTATAGSAVARGSRA